MSAKKQNKKMLQASLKSAALFLRGASQNDDE